MTLGRKQASGLLACAVALGVLSSLGWVRASEPMPLDVERPGPIPTPIDTNKPPQPREGRYTRHVDQQVFVGLLKKGQKFDAFDMASEMGDGFFDNLFTADSVFSAGANVGQGQRFTRVPRADLSGPKEWANHFPARATGPNAASCVECHTVPQHDGSGFAALNAIRDPLHSGDPSKFISRNTTHLFGMGAVQLLAEEMTDDLQGILNAAKAEACGPGAPKRFKSVRKRLIAKGTDFGWLTVEERPGIPKNRCNVITTEVQGIDSDLVVKPFQWKGVVAFIRDFNRGAAYNEVGLEATEIAGDGVDGDGDGVADEVSIGDMTALTVYIADQPRPTTKQELAKWKLIPPISPGENAAIDRGAKTFERIGCASCHTPELKLKNSIYSEPSLNPFFRDAIFPGGQNPIARGVDPKMPIQFDLTKSVVGDFRAGLFEKDGSGTTRVQLYGDLKRHDLGPEDSESIDESGTGASTWLTRPLWGLGSTSPYMHDGRATNISQAVESHGGEAASSRANYRSLTPQQRKDVDQFLLNLRLYKPDDDDS